MSVVAARPAPVVPELRQPADTLALELRRARQPIAALEAELERHRAVEREVLQFIVAAIGRRAA